MKNIVNLDFGEKIEFPDYESYQMKVPHIDLSKKIHVLPPLPPLPLPPLPPVPGINHDVMRAEIQFIHDQNKELVHIPAKYQMVYNQRGDVDMEEDLDLYIWLMEKHKLSKLSIQPKSKKFNNYERTKI